jgi:hypothetical protein
MAGVVDDKRAGHSITEALIVIAGPDGDCGDEVQKQPVKDAEDVSDDGVLHRNGGAVEPDDPELQQAFAERCAGEAFHHDEVGQTNTEAHQIDPGRDVVECSTGISFGVKIRYTKAQQHHEDATTDECQYNDINHCRDCSRPNTNSLHR